MAPYKRPITLEPGSGATSVKPKILLPNGEQIVKREEMMIKLKKLTAMQEAFVENYMNDPKRNATEAARKAGYSVDADPSFPYKIRNSKRIKIEIELREAELREARKITQEKVAERLEMIAFADIRAYFKEDGCTMKNIHDLTEREAAALSSLDMEVNPVDGQIYFSKFRKGDSIKALDSLSTLLGLNAPKKVEIEKHVDVTVNIVPFGNWLPLARSEDEIEQ